MVPELVIFDCDGVLVDSENVSNRVLQDNLSRYGLALALTECMDQFVGASMTNVMARATVLGADLPVDWVDEIYAETYARLRSGVPLVAGITDLLAHLDQAKIPFCVASNGSEDKMKITLGQNDLWNRFQGRMFSAHTLGTSKPDPDLFLAAARKLSAHPKNCVVVEDSANGVKAAMRAGMRCLGFAPDHDGQRLKTLGAEVFRDMIQVPKLLGL